MPMHQGRRWGMSDIETAEELAGMLTGMDWTLCSGFRHAGYLYLNDSTSENGAQEYAVIRESDHAQIESVTFGWVDSARGLAIIEEITRGDAGDYSDSYGRVDPRHIETETEHGRCHYCA